jgi:mRNA-degrading endonuclease YafQ of YafQ-DinJ toxin-antitoxin module
MYALEPTDRFSRRLERFGRTHPQLRSRLDRVLRDLETDPFLPRLSLHTLHGPLVGLHAVRVTRAYRIVLSLDTTARRITLLNIGTHDEVYR